MFISDVMQPILCSDSSEFCMEFRVEREKVCMVNTEDASMYNVHTLNIVIEND